MCTALRFTDNAGNMYFARNLDWSCGYGERVVITPRNFMLNSPFGATPNIKYPVYGMGVVAENTPLYFDCANTAGLAVAGLNFPGYAKYACEPHEGVTNIAAWEFPLWVTANFATVDEVESALESARIVDSPINEQFPSSFLHWIIGDATRSIVIEQTSAGLQVFRNDFDVLANQPGFAWHVENVRNYLNVTSDALEPQQWGKSELTPYGSGGGMRGLPGDYYSPSRFVRAAYLNANYPVQENEEANVSRMFHTLGGVSMIDGAARMSDGNFEKTIYTGGLSTRTNTYYWSTYENPSIQSVSLADYDTGDTELIEVQ